MILTKDGKNREVADEILMELEEAGRIDSLTPTYVLISLAFGKDNKSDQRWLIERLEGVYDMLKDVPIYKEMSRLAREGGLKEGREEGLQQGQLQALHQAVVDVVLERFPSIINLVEKKITPVNDPAILRHFVIKLSTVRTAEDAVEYLRLISGENE
jgi:hypothetical protein